MPHGVPFSVRPLQHRNSKHQSKTTPQLPRESMTNLPNHSPIPTAHCDHRKKSKTKTQTHQSQKVTITRECPSRTDAARTNPQISQRATERKQFATLSKRTIPDTNSHYRSTLGMATKSKQKSFFSLLTKPPLNVHRDKNNNNVKKKTSDVIRNRFRSLAPLSTFLLLNRPR